MAGTAARRPRVALMVEINQGYTPRRHQSARHMENAIALIEEPVAQDIPGYKKVARAVPVPLPREALGSLRAFREFLSRNFRCCSRSRRLRRYSGFREIAALARAFDLPVMPARVRSTGLSRVDTDGPR